MTQPHLIITVESNEKGMIIQESIEMPQSISRCLAHNKMLTMEKCKELTFNLRPPNRIPSKLLMALTASRWVRYWQKP